MELDGLHPRVVGELVGVLAEPFSAIYQRSWLSGEVPEDWKLANVTPIYNKGCKEDLGNYRPVSLTSVPGYGKLWSKSSWVRSHSMCMASRGSGSANMGS